MIVTAQISVLLVKFLKSPELKEILGSDVTVSKSLLSFIVDKEQRQLH